MTTTGYYVRLPKVMYSSNLMWISCLKMLNTGALIHMPLLEIYS